MHSEGYMYCKYCKHDEYADIRIHLNAIDECDLIKIHARSFFVYSIAYFTIIIYVYKYCTLIYRYVHTSL